MNARRLHELADDLSKFRDLLHEAGEADAEVRITGLVGQLRALADKADRELSRLGNPPTDPGS